MSKRVAAVASDETARLRMQRQRLRDTRPEVEIRAELHRRGLRYRVDYRPLAHSRRRADIVFTKLRIAVFVDGCFWHGCPQHGSLPKKSKREFWQTKIATNKRRDKDTDRQLKEHGWKVLRFWEHDNPVDAANKIEKMVAECKPNG